jgi:hypothetical protein
MDDPMSGRWTTAPDGLRAWEQPDGSLWRQAPDGTWVPVLSMAAERRTAGEKARTLLDRSRYLTGTRWTIVVCLAAAAIGVLLPWATAVFASASGLDTADGRLFGALLLGTTVFTAVRIRTGRAIAGVGMVLAFLAMAGIAVYDLIHVATAESGPLGITVNPGSGLYLDAVASIVAAVASWMDIRNHPRPAGLRSWSPRARWSTLVAAVVLVGAVVAIAVPLSRTDSSRNTQPPGGSDGAGGGITTTASMGQPFENRGFEITVTDVKLGQHTLPDTGDSSIGEPPTEPSNGQFVLVFLTVTNIANHPQSYDGTDNRLYDTTGRQFAECACDYFDVTNDSGFRDSQQPDTTAQGFLAFDVPADVAQLRAVAIQPDDEIGTENPATLVAIQAEEPTPETAPSSDKPADSPSPTKGPSGASALECRVMLVGPDQLKFEVLPGNATYTGQARVELVESDRGITFPVRPVVRVYRAGSSQNWHDVPSDDIGASAQPDTCSATAIS